MEPAQPGGGRNAPRSRPSRTLVLAAGVTAAVVMLPAGPASAHVRVQSEGAEAGKPATLRFRVPSEKETSTTVRLDVALPRGVTVASVPSTEGWTSSRTDAGDKEAGGGGRKEGARAHLVWTAKAGHEIEPAASRTFTVRTTPLPEEAVLRFDTAQTYSDGSVVNWDQPSTGRAEPDFPSPELVLDPAAVPAATPPGSASHEPSPSATEAEPRMSTTPDAASAADASPGRDVSLVVGASAATLVGVALVVLVRRQRRASARAVRDG